MAQPRPRLSIPPRRRAGRAARLLGAGLALLGLQGCPAPPRRPMEAMGPWAVGFRRLVAVDHTRSDRALPLAIWYPVDPGQARGRRASYTFLKHPLLTLAVTSDTAVLDAPLSRAEKWPLVIFSHGVPSLETQSPNYVETLASQGFVVVGIRHVGATVFDSYRDFKVPAQTPERPGGSGRASAATGRSTTTVTPQMVVAARRGEAWALELAQQVSCPELLLLFDVWFTMAWAEQQARSPSSFLYDAVDATRVGVTGHSGGATACLAAAAAYGPEPPDPRIRAIVSIAVAGTALIPDGTLRTVAAPALFITGDRDPVVSWERETMRAWALVASRPAALVKIRRAGHAHFADIDGFAHRAKMIGLYSWTWWALGQGGFLRVWRQFHAKGLLQPYEAQRILNQYAVAFLRLHLKGDQRAAAALTAAYAAEHEPAVELVERPAAALSR